MKFRTFTEANEYLIGAGWTSVGQDNALGHIYINPQGKEHRLVGSFGGGYELQSKGE